MKNKLTFSKIPLSNILLGLTGLVFVMALWWLGKNFVSQPSVSLEVPMVPPAFARVSLSARAAFVYDLKTGKEMYDWNGNAQLPLASLTKIMMAVTALSLIPEETAVTISPSFLQAEGDSGLFGNEQWRLKGLLDLTLVISSNDGANAIAATAGQFAGVVMAGIAKPEPVSDDLGHQQFVTAMNKKAVDIGLTQTYFLNPTGLDVSENISGGYGSARDMAILFSHAITKYPELFGATRYETGEFTSLSGLEHKVKNTNAFVGNIPSLLGSKTGYTDLAGGNLVVAFDAGPNRPIVISVLGSTEKGRFEDAEKLVYAALDYLNSQ